MASRRILFYAACLGLITSAFSFQMRANVNDQWAFDFELTKEVIGTVMSAAFLGMAVSMLIFSPLAEVLGLGRIMILAWICHATGIAGTLFSLQLVEIDFFRSIADGFQSAIPAMFSWFYGDALPAGDGYDGYWILWFSTFLVGCGNGLTEVWINPLAASLYPDQKTHKLNVLHAWWPGGLIIAGVLALFVINPAVGFDPAAEGIAEAQVAPNPEGNVPGNPVEGTETPKPNDPEIRTFSWRVKIGMLCIPLVLYGLLCLGRKFPKTERVEAQATLGAAFLQLLRPLFLILCFCMLLSAATELGTNNWQESVLTRTAGVSGTLVFIYTSAIMFVLRFFAGHIVERISPITMLMFSAVLTSAGLYWISFANTWYEAFPAATVFGVGITYFWPTMLGITAERFPKGGALAIGLMGCFGNLSIAYVLPEIGKVYDSYTVHNISTDLRGEEFETKDGKMEPIIIGGKKDEIKNGPLPPEVNEFLFPEGSKKLNPKLTPEIRDNLPPEAKNEIDAAEKQGAAYAFRRVAILPAVLVVIFALIGLTDALRGGYHKLAAKEKFA